MMMILKSVQPILFVRSKSSKMRNRGSQTHKKVKNYIVWMKLAGIFLDVDRDWEISIN